MNPKIVSMNQDLEDIVVNNHNVQVVPEETVPAFELMGFTSLSSGQIRRKWPSGLVATQDYMFATKSATGVDHNDFLRPVNWLLKLNVTREPILIGPQVQELMPHLRCSTVATLIAYSAKMIKGMVSFDMLDDYTIPEREYPIKVDSNILTCLWIFTGQLYFSRFEEYERFCVMLGLRYNVTAILICVFCVHEHDSNYGQPEEGAFDTGWYRQGLIALSCPSEVKQFDQKKPERRYCRWGHETDLGMYLV